MMTRIMLAVVASALLLINVSGCKSAKQEAAAPAPQAQSQPVMPAGHPGLAGQAAPDGGALSGKVVETMNSGGYTYVSLENGGKRTWVALPDSKVKVGQKITCQPGMPMQNFTSKTLKRTFDTIVFSGGIL